MGTWVEEVMRDNEDPSVAATSSTSLVGGKLTRPCPCGAEMAQYWNIHSLGLEWYCDGCGKSEGLK